jgi:hypothetical protein
MEMNLQTKTHRLYQLVNGLHGLLLMQHEEGSLNTPALALAGHAAELAEELYRQSEMEQYRGNERARELGLEKVPY